MKIISFIVLEDESEIRLEYQQKVKDHPDLCLIDTTASEIEALKLVNSYKPQAIILDLELHHGTGNGLSFLKSLNNLDFPFKSFILVVTNNTSEVIHSMARKFGADFILTKNQQDYSVDMVLDFLSSISSSESLGSDSQSSHKSPSKSYRESLVKRITTELDLIGISPKLKGRQYLRDAIEITLGGKQTNICAIIAKKYSKTDASVERAMQNAINHTWRNTDIETLEKNYTAYINPKKGIPTITEFIYYYADKITMDL